MLVLAGATFIPGIFARAGDPEKLVIINPTIASGGMRWR